MQHVAHKITYYKGTYNSQWTYLEIMLLISLENSCQQILMLIEEHRFELKIIQKETCRCINYECQIFLVPQGIQDVITSLSCNWFTDAQVHPGHTHTLGCFTGKAWHLSFICLFSHQHRRVCMEIVFFSVQIQIQVSSVKLFW